MALKVYSAFNYGHTVTNGNRFIDFAEGAGELVGLISTGSYTLKTYADAVASALNASGDLIYEVTVNRSNNTLIISASGDFELLISSGTHPTLSAYSLMGFTGGADLVGQSTYQGISMSGSQYITQTPLKDYTQFGKEIRNTDAVTRKTSGGINEVITYSIDSLMTMSLPAITNFLPQRYIRGTATGVEEALEFLNYAIGKKPLEFLESINAPSIYVPCILEKTTSSSKGVGFKLVERIKDTLPFYYEINGLQFLKIEER